MSIDQPIFVLRETAECPHCGLHRYLTANGECPRCKRPIGFEFINLPLSELARQLSVKELREHSLRNWFKSDGWFENSRATSRSRSGEKESIELSWVS